MKKFEYKVIPDFMDKEFLPQTALENKLNKLGAEGWELVQYVNHSFVFKREITDR